MPNTPKTKKYVVPLNEQLTMNVEIEAQGIKTSSVSAKFLWNEQNLPVKKNSDTSFDVSIGSSNDAAAKKKPLQCIAGVTVSDPARKPTVNYKILGGNNNSLCEGEMTCELKSKTTFQCKEKLEFKLKDVNNDNQKNK